MGYYGEFDVDIAVKPGCIPALEAALDAHKTFGNGKTTKTLDQHMDDIWCDGMDVAYDEAAPLEQLAMAADDTDTRKATITGYAHQKWRTWVDDLMEVLAPFVEDGSSIQIRGEEHELVEHYAEDGIFHSRSAREVWDDDEHEMRRALGHVGFANAILEAYYKHQGESAEEALAAIRDSIVARGLGDVK